MSETVLKKEERIAQSLRGLYRRYGYLPYKMNKFEAYDLYASNKDFLVGDGVITFTDTDGKLLALKPDVTLSIIKNADGNGRVYYHESVYRISGETKQFKELSQIGLENLGDTGVYGLYETVYLAAASLACISDSFVLDIAHLGILSAMLAELNAGEEFERRVLQLLAEKNEHDTRALCESYGVDGGKLFAIVKTYGSMDEVLARLAPLCQNGKSKEAYDELALVCGMLAKTEYADKIRLDFSVVNDMKYYNGFVFKGFVEGVCEGVLSGGQYDRLMRRMGKKTGAIGFAVYLDLLEGFREERAAYDIDTLILYDESVSPVAVAEAVEKAVGEGKSARALTKRDKLRYRETVDLTGGKK